MDNNRPFSANLIFNKEQLNTVFRDFSNSGSA